jgi:DNA-directed RNA polymerase specialized sigma24 family protein
MLPNQAPPNDPLAEFHSRYAEKLRAFLLRITRSADIAQELSGDVWLKLTQIQRGATTRAQDATGFGSSKAEWAYLARMALNRYRDWLRRQRTMSIEDLADRIFTSESERESATEAIDRLAATRTNYERLDRLRDSLHAVLDAFVNDRSPPHQTIVFGFNRPLQWDPIRIVQVQAHRTLGSLGQQLCEELAMTHLQAPDGDRRLWRQLKERLAHPVSWEHVRAPCAETTELDSYFKNKDLRRRAKETTQWSLSVHRRIVKHLIAVNAFAVRNKQ